MAKHHHAIHYDQHTDRMMLVTGPERGWPEGYIADLGDAHRSGWHRLCFLPGRGGQEGRLSGPGTQLPVTRLRETLIDRIRPNTLWGRLVALGVLSEFVPSKIDHAVAALEAFVRVTVKPQTGSLGLDPARPPLVTRTGPLEVIFYTGEVRQGQATRPHNVWI